MTSPPINQMRFHLSSHSKQHRPEIKCFVALRGVCMSFPLGKSPLQHHHPPSALHPHPLKGPWGQWVASAHAWSYAGPHDRMLECKSGYWVTDVTPMIPKHRWEQPTVPRETPPRPTHIFCCWLWSFRFCFYFSLWVCLAKPSTFWLSYHLFLTCSIIGCLVFVQYKPTICCYVLHVSTDIFTCGKIWPLEPCLAGHEELSIHTECQGETQYRSTMSPKGFIALGKCTFDRGTINPLLRLCSLLACPTWLLSSVCFPVHYCHGSSSSVKNFTFTSICVLTRKVKMFYFLPQEKLIHWFPQIWLRFLT